MLNRTVYGVMQFNQLAFSPKSHTWVLKQISAIFLPFKLSKNVLTLIVIVFSSILTSIANRLALKYCSVFILRQGECLQSVCV